MVNAPTLVFLATALSLVAVTSVASPTVSVKPAATDAAARTWCRFADDALTVEVRDGSTLLSAYSFCSSYGKASADLAVDVRGRSYLLLNYSQGRGPNATSGYLSVFRVAFEMVEYVRVPISSATGPTSRWEYQYTVTTPRQGGLQLTFNLHLSPPDAKGICCEPADVTRTIAIDAGDS